jgi:hypothetical protein
MAFFIVVSIFLGGGALVWCLLNSERLTTLEAKVKRLAATQGPQGEPGPRGYKGEQGEAGEQGDTGPQGPAAAKKPHAPK